MRTVNVLRVMKSSETLIDQLARMNACGFGNALDLHIAHDAVRELISTLRAIKSDAVHKPATERTLADIAEAAYAALLRVEGTV